MKIALCQTDIVFEDKEHNLNKAEEFIAKAANAGANLILFPEMSFTGFSMNTDVTKDNDCKTENRMKELARKFGINIGFGRVEKCDDMLSLNLYEIVDHKGDIVLTYAKRHPFSYGGESTVFKGGDIVKSCVIDGIPVSVQICFDLRFPGGFWKLADDTHLMIVPANWADRRVEQFKALLRARAIENQYYVIGLNCVGQQGKVSYNGQSVVYNPKGEELLSCGDSEGLYYFDFEDDVSKAREKFPVLNDRREDEWNM